jgi:hypothetical protein
MEFFAVGPALFGLLLYFVLFFVVVWVLYSTIRGAVRAALDDHQRKMLWHEATGLWYSGRPPKGLPGATQLTRAERKQLPKEERAEKGA